MPNRVLVSSGLISTLYPRFCRISRLIVQADNGPPPHPPGLHVLKHFPHVLQPAVHPFIHDRLDGPFLSHVIELGPDLRNFLRVPPSVLAEPLRSSASPP